MTTLTQSDHRTAKLPHGYRIEVYTYTAKGCDRAECRAEVYCDSELRSEHRRTWNGLKTVGDLIRNRNEWLATLTPEV